MTETRWLERIKIPLYQRYFFISLLCYGFGLYGGWFGAQEDEMWPGWFFSFFSAVFMIRHPGLLAHVLFIASIVVFFKWKKLYLFPVAGLLLASTYIYFNQYYACFKECEWVRISYYGWGYMLWLWSFGFLAIGHLNKAKIVTKSSHISFMALILCIFTALPTLKSMFLYFLSGRI